VINDNQYCTCINATVTIRRNTDSKLYPHFRLS